MRRLQVSHQMDRNRDRRTANLAEWHRLLLERLIGSEAEDRLDRLARPPALGGPELQFLQAQLAYERGDAGSPRSLVQKAPQHLPGHEGFLDFASEIGAPLPARARQVLEERSRCPTGVGPVRIGPLTALTRFSCYTRIVS